MKPRAAGKLGIDLLMTLGLLFLMGYQLWGEAAHEWAGTGMLALLLAHHFLNRGWYRSLGSSGRTGMGRLRIGVNLCLFAAMLAQMYSGIRLSRHVFTFLPLEGGMALARRLHILGAHWGFVLMSVHLGLHWSGILGVIRRRSKGAIRRRDTSSGAAHGQDGNIAARRRRGNLGQSGLRRAAAWLCASAAAGYGAYVFLDRRLADYLFLRTEFVFLDYGEPIWSFYLDYVCLMCLWVSLAHCAAEGLRRRARKKAEAKRRS